MSTKVLCIFDGLGLVPGSPNNAPSLARMPNFRKVLGSYPWFTLNADGEAVGQEEGLVGNSEVGHLNIGGLKLVKQLSLQVTESSYSGFTKYSDCPDQLFNPVELLQKKFDNSPKKLHLIGLFSVASVHSDMRHWAGAIKAGQLAGAEKIALHLISDGRDSDRQSLVETWQKFRDKFSDLFESNEEKIFLGSLGGRFYTMDRDKNYQRNWQGLAAMFDQDLLEHNREGIVGYFKSLAGTSVDLFNFQSKYEKTDLSNLEQHLSEQAQESYSEENYDETIVPRSMSGQENLIQAGDSLWLVNFRTDRMRQAVTILADLNKQLSLGLAILATNDYKAEREIILNEEPAVVDFTAGYYPIFRPGIVQNTLAERISEMGKTQLHIAETEKYNHVTFFLNGGQDKVSPGEDRQLIPSNKVKSHGEKPEMKTREVADYILENYQKYDYIIVNFACPDMIGHTGDISASVKALEVLDEKFGEILQLSEKEEMDLILIADHGNIEIVGEIQDGDDTYVDTAHNADPVPCIFIKKDFDSRQFLTNLEEIKQKFDLNLDLETVKVEFNRDNRVDLSNENIWFTQEQIPAHKLPLWYSGAFLLAL
jgi:2,3-bisphosphoglycerate-independent phosphoglycerate mutase